MCLSPWLDVVHKEAQRLKRWSPHTVTSLDMLGGVKLLAVPVRLILYLQHVILDVVVKQRMQFLKQQSLHSFQGVFAVISQNGVQTRGSVETSFSHHRIRRSGSNLISDSHHSTSSSPLGAADIDAVSLASDDRHRLMSDV